MMPCNSMLIVFLHLQFNMSHFLLNTKGLSILCSGLAAQFSVKPNKRRFKR